MTSSYQGDDAHDPITGAYIKPEDRVKAEPDQFTITEEEEPTVSVGTSANEYNPDLDPRVHPELNTNYSYSGKEEFTIDAAGIDTSANVVIDDSFYADTVVTGAAGTQYDDPSYYASAVDYSVAGMGTGSYDSTYNVPPIETHDHAELKETLDRVLDQHIHLLHHQHETMQKLDELSQKVDHLLEHMHQPMTGTLQIDCPQKVGAGYTV